MAEDEADEVWDIVGPPATHIVILGTKLVIGLVRLESLKPGFVDSRFESLTPGFANPIKALVCL